MHAKTPAESIIETIVALTVIVLTTITALSLMRVSIQGNQVIEKKVIALNLAEEGLEALRNIRDSNYLRFASDPDGCWNKLNVTDVTACGTAKEITQGKIYYLDQNFSADPLFGWQLKEITNQNTHGVLDLYSIDWNSDADPDAELYAQTGISISGFSLKLENAFHRQIDILSTGGNYYEAMVTVSWEDGETSRSLSLTRTIDHVY